MAEETQNTSSGDTRSFDKGLNEDIKDFHLPSNEWTQARNAINNSVSGDLGKLGNEPANLECISAPYPIIGMIHIIEDKWAVFSTDNTDSEIGLFIESNCGREQETYPAYQTIVNAKCLKFNLENLIIGTSRSTSTCTYKLYWDDGINPSRVLEIDADNPDRNLYTNPNSTIPWIQTCTTTDGCLYCDNTPNLDCDKTRLAQFMSPICPRVENGVSGGNLLNGSYMVAMAYAVKGQKISDWYVSNVQSIWTHQNSSGSIDVFIDSIDPDYNQIRVAVIYVVNQQAVARDAGIYSTRQIRLSFDSIFDTWPAIPIEQLPIMTPIVDKSDAMYNVGDYLIRVGPTSKEDFNYQPFANQIVAKWQSVEYAADYYYKGGNNTGYMRDEVYAFFIQWIYDTGDRSAAYHIPGRPKLQGIGPTGSLPFPAGINDDSVDASPNAILSQNLVWEIYNTALQTATPNTVLPDGGVVVSEGVMGYWESTEIYPDNTPQIWNSVNNPTPGFNTTSSPYSAFGALDINDLNLCGKPIRHHKFPEDNLSPEANRYNAGTGDTIRIMGVKFENIKAPTMNDGVTPIPGIIGYRILRGTRNGNKSIIAKGMINNMHSYEIAGVSTANKIGLYPNYPYNDLTTDYFLSTKRTKSTGCLGPNTGGIDPSTYDPMLGGVSNNPLDFRFTDNYYTFHSPETNFNNPFLAAKEFRIYQNIHGNVVGKYELSEEHPKEKLITDIVFIVAALAGIGIASQQANGKTTTTYADPHIPGYSMLVAGATNGSSPAAYDFATIAAYYLALTGANLTQQAYELSGAEILFNLLGFDNKTTPIFGLNTRRTALNAAAISPAFVQSFRESQIENGYLANVPGPLKFLSAIPLYMNAFTDGTDSVIRLVRSMLRFKDYAVRYHSHGFYNNAAGQPATFRAQILEQQYINPEIVNFMPGSPGNPSISINNLYRNRTVALKTTPDTITTPPVNDVTRYVGSQLPSAFWPTKNGQPVLSIENLCSQSIDSALTGGQVCSSWYGALKVRINNQYGQLNRIVQIPIDSCYTTFTVDLESKEVITGDETTSIFGGDIYVNRYTEKNTFFYFYDWLYGQPDGAQLNYEQHQMIPYPTYWANFNQFQTTDFTTSFGTWVSSFGGVGFSDVITPRDYYVLDGPSDCSTLGGFLSNSFKFNKNGWFYLFNSGVRDFFVESEINLAQRDYGDIEAQRIYNPIQGGDTKDLFNTNIIKSGNYYKYDQSLSIARLFINYSSWAQTQGIDYNPYDAETCFIYQPTRVIYSLPAQYEGLADGWKVFLPNNYYDFNNVVTCIKPVNKSGAMIFFDAASPVQFQGTDQLETGLGTKLTIGDGGLFSQPMQQVINVDASHEYGSCQNRLSVINTPAGLYWISQNQGKIFSMGEGLNEISNINMKWWFAQYLPYRLVKDFPGFELLDNPLIGIGCQSVYDNENGLLYFSKKDYALKRDIDETVNYVGGNVFNILSGEQVLTTVELGNPDSKWDLYFDDCSWTVSFDPKTKNWLSYHDWHQTLSIPGKNTFMTVSPVDLKSIWIHNRRCDLYCNYYGEYYPFEVEFTVNSGQTVNSLRSVEYIMEAYKYAPNCYDRFHSLDYNFDEAIIYNTEQVSGLLKLSLTPRQNPTLMLQYPIINPTNINSLFAKVENKYRFNQFWDITADRGEYNPLVERPIWDTEPNGYIRFLNPFNLNYNKDPFQRKKFRHYTVSILLRKLSSQQLPMDKKMLVMLADVKNLYSPR